MPGDDTAGLVGRVTRMLALLPTGSLAADAQTLNGRASAGLTPAERRARLALRIAILKRGDPVLPVTLPMPVFVPDPPVQADPAPLPEAPKESAPPSPRPKPARISMSTLRLEDAALLLAAASEPEPAPQASVDPAAAARNRPAAPRAKVGDLGDAFAALSALAEVADPAPAPMTDPAVTAAEEPPKADPAPAKKAKRRSGSVSATDGLANAAAAFAAFDMPAPDEAPPAASPSATEEAMASGIAALRDPG